MMMEKQLKVRDLRQKEKFVIDDTYLDKYARILGIPASAVYMSLCRHADRNQECFPAQVLIAREHNISMRSVKRAIKILKEANIIAVRRERLSHGRWGNNVYVLLDRSQWRPPWVLHVPWTIRGQKRHQPGDNKDQTRGHQSPTKETHRKETHIKDILKNTEAVASESPKYGHPNINYLMEILRKSTGGLIDGSERENRRYCKLLLLKFRYPRSPINKRRLMRPDEELNPEQREGMIKAVNSVEMLIRISKQSRFHSQNATSFKYLYNNAAKIIAEYKGRQDKVHIIS